MHSSAAHPAIGPASSTAQLNGVLLPFGSSDSPHNKGGDNVTLLNGGDANAQLSVILTVRMLMQGKEVGSIIGKRGDYVRQIREKSGAKINISDGSCPERIVTISGPAVAIDRAFTMVAHKFEDDMQALQCSGPKPPITLRLLIPASQCGSLIGKGGAKIRDIRDKTGASLQVASEMLSNSTEKPVTISGSSEALIGCMREVCQILLDAPAKGPTIQYKPVNAAYNPLAVVNSAAAIAAAANAAKNSAAVSAAALPLGIQAALGQHQQAAYAQQMGLLPAVSAAASNPLASLQELALLQHQNPYFDVSRFLLPANAATFAGGAAGPPATAQLSAAALPHHLAAQQAAVLSNPALLMGQMNGAATAQQKPNQAGLELYGLDPNALALLAQQQQQGIDYSALLAAAQMHAQQKDPAALLQQQQQHIQMLYQQQQAEASRTSTGDAAATTAVSQQLIGGRAIGSNGQPVKEASSSAAAQKRFAPY